MVLRKVFCNRKHLLKGRLHGCAAVGLFFNNPRQEDFVFIVFDHILTLCKVDERDQPVRVWEEFFAAQFTS